MRWIIRIVMINLESKDMLLSPDGITSENL
jgi:hypothetical protein